MLVYIMNIFELISNFCVARDMRMSKYQKLCDFHKLRVPIVFYFDFFNIILNISDTYGKFMFMIELGK